MILLLQQGTMGGSKITPATARATSSRIRAATPLQVRKASTNGKSPFPSVQQSPPALRPFCKSGRQGSRILVTTEDASTVGSQRPDTLPCAHPVAVTVRIDWASR